MSKAKIVDKKSIESILGEKKILSELHHPFIVNMVYSFQDFDYLYLVMEILSGGNLRYHLTLRKKFNENQIKFLIGCIMTGLKYIHAQNILHRDIKPENLVFDSNGYLRITDFGIAKKYVVNNRKEIISRNIFDFQYVIGKGGFGKVIHKLNNIKLLLGLESKL